MTNLYKLIDITNDPLYVKGREVGYGQGYREGMLSSVRSVILSTKFDNRKISSLTGIKRKVVKELRKELKKNRLVVKSK